MSKVGGGSFVLAGLFLVFLGILISSDILEALLDVLGVIVIVLGAVIGIIGLIRVFTGGSKARSSDF